MSHRGWFIDNRPRGVVYPAVAFEEDHLKQGTELLIGLDSGLRLLAYSRTI